MPHVPGNLMQYKTIRLWWKAIRARHTIFDGALRG